MIENHVQNWQNVSSIDSDVYESVKELAGIYNLNSDEFINTSLRNSVHNFIFQKDDKTFADEIVENDIFQKQAKENIELTLQNQRQSDLIDQLIDEMSSLHDYIDEIEEDFEDREEKTYHDLLVCFIPC